MRNVSLWMRVLFTSFAWWMSWSQVAVANPASYTVTELGSLQGLSLNNSSQVVGYQFVSGNQRPFLWSNGTLTELGTLGGTWGNAEAISDNGLVVGTAATPSGNYSATYWSGEVATPIFSGTTVRGRAKGVNESGQIAGYSTQSGPEHAFLYSNGVITDLGTLGGSVSLAYGINENGEVVGYSYPATGNYRAFLYSNGIMMNLGTLPGFLTSRGLAVNDNSQVVGTAWKQEQIGYSWVDINHAFTWVNGQMQDLGTLGGGNSHAFGVNSSGQIVGTAQLSSGWNQATLWSEGTAWNLNQLLLSPGWDLTSAYAINDQGQILANAWDGVSARSVLLTPSTVLPAPIPLPQAVWLFISGVVTLGSLIRRRVKPN